ncbi:MAG: septal ring lytic transglycosylase RlpA family protein [Acidimicrobiales bacterium]
MKNRLLAHWRQAVIGLLIAPATLVPTVMAASGAAASSVASQAGLGATSADLATVHANAVKAQADATRSHLNGAKASAQLNAILLQVAVQTDRANQASAQVVNDQLALSRFEADVSQAQSAITASAINAYIAGPISSPGTSLGSDLAGLSASTTASVYMGIALQQQKRHMAAYLVLRDQLGARLVATRASQKALNQAAAQLSQDRHRLALAVQADAARAARETDMAAADLAIEDQARLAVMDQPVVGPVSASHQLATQNQLTLMGRYPFGPLTPGGALDPRLGALGAPQTGIASWYGPGFDGRPTATGAIYDENAWTVASPDLPLGTFLLLSRGSARVLALVNDRGPYVPGRFLDLSHAVALALGDTGLAQVSAQVVGPG